MAFVFAKQPAALMLGAGALALAVGTASAAPLVKECGKTGSFVIGFSQANNAEPYRQHVNDELTAAAKKVPQFTLQIADGAGNVNTQTSQMDNFITQKVDLILISPFEASPLTPVVARAMKAGIPVVELDRKTVGDPGKDYTAFIGGDNFKIAQEAGKYVAGKLLPDGGEVAVLEGLPSSTPAVERLNGFKDGVKANAKIQVVAEQAADWLPDKAQTAFAAMLQAHPNIKDGLPGPAGGIRAVAEGQWAATFTYPTGGPEAIEMAKAILLDCAESVPTTVTVPTTAITPDNAKSLMGK
jgi:ribose transport system substrate-binding protein